MTQHQEEIEARLKSAALAAAGVGIAAMAEVMSLTVKGTAVVIGVAPLAILGAVAGLAVYGLIELVSSRDDTTTVTPLYLKSGDRTAQSVEVSEELISSLETFFLYGNSDCTPLNPDGYDLCGEEDNDMDIN